MKKTSKKPSAEVQFGARIPASLSKQFKKVVKSRGLSVKDAVKAAIEGFVGNGQ